MAKLEYLLSIFIAHSYNNWGGVGWWGGRVGREGVGRWGWVGEFWEIFLPSMFVTSSLSTQCFPKTLLHWPFSRLCFGTSPSGFLLPAIPTNQRTPWPRLRRETELYSLDHCRGRSGSFSPGWLCSAGVSRSHPVPAICRPHPAERRCAQLLPGSGAPGQCTLAVPQVPSAAHVIHSPDPGGAWDRVWTPALFTAQAVQLPRRSPSSASHPPSTPVVPGLSQQVAFGALLPGEHFGHGRVARPRSVRSCRDGGRRTAERSERTGLRPERGGRSARRKGPSRESPRPGRKGRRPGVSWRIPGPPE